jgi:hypothetical protein
MDCWSDFCFNLVSMALVWVFFNKNAAGESMIAVLLCMGVAAFDIVLLVMRWLWFEQYINHGCVCAGGECPALWLRGRWWTVLAQGCWCLPQQRHPVRGLVHVLDWCIPAARVLCWRPVPAGAQ